MRRLAFASLLATMLLAPLRARADVGPPPSCPKGSHDEYHYGHHCVPDGANDAGPEPAPPEPDENPTPAPSASVSASTSTATASPTHADTAPNEPAPTPSSHACACTVAGHDAGATLLGVALAAALAVGAFARRR